MQLSERAMDCERERRRWRALPSVLQFTFRPPASPGYDCHVSYVAQLSRDTDAHAAQKLGKLQQMPSPENIMDHVRRWTAALALLMLVTGCRDRAPEKPTDPPLPTTSQVAPITAQEDKPTLVSRIEAGGLASEYRAYFNNQHLARIRETYADSKNTAEYQFEGARLMRFAGANAELILDGQGRVERAIENGAPLPAEKIDAIRTRANTLRSHALALHASRAHMH